MFPAFFLLAADESPGYFTQALIDFVNWIIGWLCSLLMPFVEWILGLLPPEWTTTIDSTLSALAVFFGAINQWIALDWAFSILAAWIAFMIAFIIVKLVIKLFIPFVG
jgi:hypothetical protein